jgi:hypothetical protein
MSITLEKQAEMMRTALNWLRVEFNSDYIMTGRAFVFQSTELLDQLINCCIISFLDRLVV